MSELREMDEVKQGSKQEGSVRIGYQHLKNTSMDIHEIATHITGKIIEAVDVIYGEDTLTLYLEDGSIVELIVDSIHCDIPDYDD